MRPLRIFLVTGNTAAGVAGSTIYRDNILGTLQDCGHAVEVFNFQDRMNAMPGASDGQVKDVVTSELLSAFARARQAGGVDLAFCLLSNQVVHPEALETLRDAAPTVNYTTNFHQFHLVADIARHVTVSTYISLPAKAAFDALGARSFWMPMAANPRLYRPSTRRDRYAAFVGTAYGARPYYAWRLLQRGVDLHIYGPGWSRLSPWMRLARNLGEPLLYMLGPTNRRLTFLHRNQRRVQIDAIHEQFDGRIHGPLSDAAMLDVLATSDAVVNLAESRYNHDPLNPRVLRGCNLRDFEVPMSGSALFTQHSDEVGFFYEPGREVVVFQDDVDLADALERYALDLPGLRAIAEAGHRRAVAEHTWERRFASLFAHLGLN